jgi:predicted metal-dependent hydrolase
MIDYTLIRERRKSVSLRITKDATVEVRAPLTRDKKEIDGFVASKERWIIEKLALARAHLAAREDFAPEYGGSAPMLGRACAIVAGEVKRAKLDGYAIIMPPNLDVAGIKSALIALYREVAAERTADAISRFAPVMGVQATAVHITSAERRWGSCSGRNSISFAWRLAMAPQTALDYVVVHELAHILQHNHSPQFWAIVAQVFPDYAARKKQLADTQYKVAGFDLKD